MDENEGLSQAQKDYRNDLKDPRWTSLATRLKEEKNWTCQKCGAKDRHLRLHHMQYIKGRKPWQYPDCMLIVLCNVCHDAIHGTKNNSSFYAEEDAKEIVLPNDDAELHDIIESDLFPEVLPDLIPEVKTKKKKAEGLPFLQSHHLSTTIREEDRIAFNDMIQFGSKKLGELTQAETLRLILQYALAHKKQIFYRKRL